MLSEEIFAVEFMSRNGLAPSRASTRIAASAKVALPDFQMEMLNANVAGPFVFGAKVLSTAIACEDAGERTGVVCEYVFVQSCVGRELQPRTIAANLGWANISCARSGRKLRSPSGATVAKRGDGRQGGLGLALSLVDAVRMRERNHLAGNWRGIVPLTEVATVAGTSRASCGGSNCILRRRDARLVVILILLAIGILFEHGLVVVDRIGIGWSTSMRKYNVWVYCSLTCSCSVAGLWSEVGILEPSWPGNFLMT